MKEGNVVKIKDEHKHTLDHIGLYSFKVLEIYSTGSFKAQTLDGKETTYYLTHYFYEVIQQTEDYQIF